MLSYQPIGEPHPGHRDLGVTTDSPRGSLWMQTFAKEPKMSPSASATAGESPLQPQPFTSGAA
jgi:hypothetical protein